MREDAAMISDLSLTYVSIGELGWSRLNPSDGQYSYDCLNRKINVLVSAGVKIIIGTPTAKSPESLIDKIRNYSLALAKQAQYFSMLFAAQIVAAVDQQRYYCSHAHKRPRCDTQSPNYIAIHLTRHSLER